MSLSLRELIRSDTDRLRDGNPKKSFFALYFRRPLFRYTVWLRITHALKQHHVLRYTPLLLFSYAIFRHNEFKYGVHISSNITIGKGLLVSHGDGVYVNCTSIGDNFTVFQNVTFGTHHGKVPTIEDCVTVMPGAVIYGDVTLHNGCTVGANSVVNKDVPENTIVIGAPARILSKDERSFHV